jgi:dihydromethanopterin reductase
MSLVCIIAAIRRSGQLGLNGEIPWFREGKGDTVWFREQTRDGVVVVGRNTWSTVEHLDGTHNRLFIVDGLFNGVPVTRELVQRVAGGRTVWIAGGAKTYTRWLANGWVDRSILSHIDYDGPADCHMPPLWRNHDAKTSVG